MKKSVPALVELPVDKIAAIVTSEGAANSHMVIVACAWGFQLLWVSLNYQSTPFDDIEMIVDAYQGRVLSIHRAAYANVIKEVQKEEEQIAKDLKQYETKDAITPDGSLFLCS